MFKRLKVDPLTPAFSSITVFQPKFLQLLQHSKLFIPVLLNILFC